MLTALLLLLIAGASCIVFTVAAGLVSPTDVAGGWLPVSLVLDLFEGVRGKDRLLLMAGSLALGLLALALLLRQVGRRPRGRRLHLLSANESGFVAVDSRGIAAVATHAAITTPGVVNAGVEVRGAGNAPISLRVTLEVFPGADIKRAGASVQQKVHDAVEHLIGLEVRAVAVGVHVLEPDELATLLN